MTPAEAEKALRSDIGSFTHDPLAFCSYVYPWGRGELSESSGARAWQSDILKTIGTHLQDPSTRYTPLCIAVASGKGIGKSALISQIVSWAMSSCEDTKVIITANTGTQLTTKTHPEVSKWFRLSLNRHWWTVNAKSVRVNDKLSTHEATWRTDFIPWSENNVEAFAGLHNKGKRIVVIFDEASAIPQVIWEVAEGALTDENTEIIWLAFGNPTKNTGRFRECFGKLAHRWVTRQIDSRSVDGTNKEQIARQLADYGEDSDWFRVNVRGEFPRAGSNQFISSELVENCRRYKASGYELLPKIMAIDVARFGDDQTVMVTRQGRKATLLKRYRGLDNVQVAERAIEWILKEKPDAIVVDGDGLGAGVVDHLRHRGYGSTSGRFLFEFHGGAAANDPAMYFNRRAEVWGLLRDALAAGMEIPNEPELASDLTSLEYYISNKQQIQLEKKEELKARGFSSPDAGDALAMTWGVQVAPKQKPAPHRSQPGGAWS